MLLGEAGLSPAPAWAAWGMLPDPRARKPAGVVSYQGRALQTALLARKRAKATPPRHS